MGNGPIPRHEEFGPDQPTLADLHRFFKEGIERERKENKSLLDKMDELIEMRGTSQRLATLEHDARQPRRRQTCEQTQILASARRAPLLQFKRYMGIAVLQTGLIPTRCVLPASVVTPPDLRPSPVQGMIPW